MYVPGTTSCPPDVVLRRRRAAPRGRGRRRDRAVPGRHEDVIRELVVRAAAAVEEQARAVAAVVHRDVRVAAARAEQCERRARSGLRGRRVRGQRVVVAEVEDATLGDGAVAGDDGLGLELLRGKGSRRVVHGESGGEGEGNSELAGHGFSL